MFIRVNHGTSAASTKLKSCAAAKPDGRCHHSVQNPDAGSLLAKYMSCWASSCAKPQLSKQALLHTNSGYWVCFQNAT